VEAKLALQIWLRSTSKSWGWETMMNHDKPHWAKIHVDSLILAMGDSPKKIS
jgi:hypothetical protein